MSTLIILLSEPLACATGSLLNITHHHRVHAAADGEHKHGEASLPIIEITITGDVTDSGSLAKRVLRNAGVDLFEGHGDHPVRGEMLSHYNLNGTIDDSLFLEPEHCGTTDVDGNPIVVHDVVIANRGDERCTLISDET